jgi:hypothetical protein
MDESTDIEMVIIPLPDDALQWLERALQWSDDLERYDRLNKTLSMRDVLGDMTPF